MYFLYFILDRIEWAKTISRYTVPLRQFETWLPGLYLSYAFLRSHMQCLFKMHYKMLYWKSYLVSDNLEIEGLNNAYNNTILRDIYPIFLAFYSLSWYTYQNKSWYTFFLFTVLSQWD